MERKFLEKTPKEKRSIVTAMIDLDEGIKHQKNNAMKNLDLGL